MEINLGSYEEELIEVGDVVLTECGLYYLLVKLERDKYPYTFITLDTMEERNSFVSLEFINDNRFVIRADAIKKVIKSSNLVICVKGS